MILTLPKESQRGRASPRTGYLMPNQVSGESLLKGYWVLGGTDHYSVIILQKMVTQL